MDHCRLHKPHLVDLRDRTVSNLQNLRMSSENSVTTRLNISACASNRNVVYNGASDQISAMEENSTISHYLLSR